MNIQNIFLYKLFISFSLDGKINKNFYTTKGDKLIIDKKYEQTIKKGIDANIGTFEDSFSFISKGKGEKEITYDYLGYEYLKKNNFMFNFNVKTNVLFCLFILLVNQALHFNKDNHHYNDSHIDFAVSHWSVIYSPIILIFFLNVLYSLNLVYLSKDILSYHLDIFFIIFSTILYSLFIYLIYLNFTNYYCDIAYRSLRKTSEFKKMSFNYWWCFLAHLSIFIFNMYHKNKTLYSKYSISQSKLIEFKTSDTQQLSFINNSEVKDALEYLIY